MPEPQQAEEQPYLTWDTCDIAQGQAAYLQEENPELSEDEAFQQACGDSNLYDMEWESLCDCLTELMERINPDGLEWRADVRNAGWQKRSGHKIFSANDGNKLLQEILPKTECTFKIYDRQDHIAIENAHHDSPMGGEMYYIRPIGDDDE